MKKTIKQLGLLFNKITVDRQKRWEEFRSFHREMIEVMTPEVSKAIGIVEGVCCINNYRIEFTPEDFAWWGLVDKSKIQLIPVDEIKKKVKANLSKYFNNSKLGLTMEEVDSFLDILEYEN